MSCTDCFNGCAGSINPDKCVKYTGVDHPQLNITNGDSLFSVDENIILKILDIMVGDGVIPQIGVEDVCSQVNGYLPPVGPYTLNDYLIAIAKTACSAVNDLISIQDELDIINSPYSIDSDCIPGVGAGENNQIHVVLQATINAFCTLSDDFDNLVTNLPSTYVALADINNIIDTRIAVKAPGNNISAKMVPYTAIEYYGPLSNFATSGAGLDLTASGGANWLKVYLCNGANGTPDKRGRVAVGVTTVTGGGAFNPAVDPGVQGNPNYTLNTPSGANTVTLTSLQVPSHTHIATATVTDPGHTHVITATAHNAAGSGSESVLNPGPNNFNTSSSTTGITVAVTNSNSGGGGSHSNIQPVLPCYYIMYIP